MTRYADTSAVFEHSRLGVHARNQGAASSDAAAFVTWSAIAIACQAAGLALAITPLWPVWLRLRR